jgi:predicted phosphoribosyltransferase
LATSNSRRIAAGYRGGETGTLGVVSAYRDRVDAGRRLAGSLAHLRGSDALVLGIPRGGVVVAAPVADAIGGELGCVLAAKVGAPWSSELAIGAVGTDGVPMLDAEMIRRMGLDPDDVTAQVTRAHAEVLRRAEVFGAGLREVTGRVVVVVDDGVATGATLRAALAQVRRGDPDRLVCAVPVGPPATIDLLAFEADEVVCPLQPDRLRAVGEWYDDFSQTDDGEVLALLGAGGGR